MGIENIIRDVNDFDKEAVTESIIANQNPFFGDDIEDNEHFAVVVIVPAGAEDNYIDAIYEYGDNLPEEEFDEWDDTDEDLNSPAFDPDLHLDPIIERRINGELSSNGGDGDLDSSDFGFSRSGSERMLDTLENSYFSNFDGNFDDNNQSTGVTSDDVVNSNTRDAYFFFGPGGDDVDDLMTAPIAITDSSDGATTAGIKFSPSITEYINTIRPFPYGKIKKKIQRSNVGKRKSRHLDNARYLEALGKLTKTEDDEDVGTFSGNTLRFSKLREALDTKEVLTSFMNGLDDDSDSGISCSNGGSKKRRKTNRRKRSNKKRLSAGDKAFNNLTQTEKSFFNQRNAPLGLINYLDSQVFSFFQSSPTSMFISDPLSSFERMILHGIAHYYRLHSLSFNDHETSTRLLSITNPFDFFEPEINLTTYLENLHGERK